MLRAKDFYDIPVAECLLFKVGALCGDKNCKQKDIPCEARPNCEFRKTKIAEAKAMQQARKFQALARTYNDTLDLVDKLSKENNLLREQINDLTKGLVGDNHVGN